MVYVQIVTEVVLLTTEDWYRMRCSDEDCEYNGKKLVWIPKDDGTLRLVCPSMILTQTDYNLKYVKYESKAQMEEEE